MPVDRDAARAMLCSETENTSIGCRPEAVRMPGERFSGTVGLRSAPGADGVVLLAAGPVTERMAAASPTATIATVGEHLRAARLIHPELQEVCVVLDAATVGRVGDLVVLGERRGTGMVLPLALGQPDDFAPLHNLDLFQVAITWNGFYATLLSAVTPAGWYFCVPWLAFQRRLAGVPPDVIPPETAERPPFLTTMLSMSKGDPDGSEPYAPSVQARLALQRLCSMPWTLDNELPRFFSTLFRWLEAAGHQVPAEDVARLPGHFDPRAEGDAVVCRIRNLRSRDPEAGRDEVIRILRERSDIVRDRPVEALHVALGIADLPLLTELAQLAGSPQGNAARDLLRICPGNDLFAQRLGAARHVLQLLRTESRSDADDPSANADRRREREWKLLQAFEGFGIGALAQDGTLADAEIDRIGREWPEALRALAAAALRDQNVSLAIRFVRAQPNPDWPKNAIFACPEHLPPPGFPHPVLDPDQRRAFFEGCFDPDGDILGPASMTLFNLTAYLDPPFSPAFVRRLAASPALARLKHRIAGRTRNRQLVPLPDSILFGLSLFCGAAFEPQLSYLPIERRRISTSFFELLRMLDAEARAP